MRLIYTTDEMDKRFFVTSQIRGDLSRPPVPIANVIRSARNGESG